MKSLMIKDLMNLKGQAKIFIALLIFYIVFATSTQNASMFTMMIIIFSAMAVITSFTCDEQAHWDKYALSMPISRKDMVLQKYLFGVILIGGGFILALLFSIFSKAGEVKTALLFCIGALTAGILFLSLCLPLIFKFGIEKGRIFMLLVILIPYVIIGLLQVLEIKMPSQEKLIEMIYLSPVIALLIMALSVGISFQIYKRKEF